MTSLGLPWCPEPTAMTEAPPTPEDPWSARAEALRATWARVNPYAGVLFFLGGALWDALTLVRIDRTGDTLLLFGYLLGLATLIVVEHRVDVAPERWPRLAPHAAWITYGTQFFLGGLLSAYLVYYGRSGAWGPSAAFLAVLGALMLGNEFLHDHLRRSWSRVALFTFATTSFAMFAIPVLTSWPGPGLFVAAGLVGLLAGVLLASAMHVDLRDPLDTLRSPRVGRHAGVALATVLTLGTLDLIGLIPPVPLAILELGVFHDVTLERAASGEGGGRSRVYALHHDPAPWWAPWRDEDRPFRWHPGEQAHVFSAIFAPSGMQIEVFHRWQVWDEARGVWQTTDRLDVSGTAGGIHGGADQGWRTFSRKARLREGEWRVIVETETGRELGRVGFTVIAADGPPPARVTRVWR